MRSKALVVLLLAIGCVPDAREPKAETDDCADDAMEATTWYADGDGDGYGDPGASVAACAQPDGFVESDLDCDDTDASVHPGADEICDGIDNNCDGGIDDDAMEATTWYADADGDGYGDHAETASSCVQPENFVDNSDDCDDTNALVNPGLSEDCSTDWDDNCSGSTNDLDAAGCTALFYDGDEDGYGIAETACHCEADGYYSADNATDCDDADATVNSGATDIGYDGVDLDCDGRDDYDQDEDGYVPTIYVGRATTYVSGSGGLPGNDCDDTDAAVNPGRTDAWYDGIDQDCSGNDDYDQDRDGHVPDEYEGLATAYVSDSGELPGNDCDDTDATVNPEAPDIGYDGIDQDCDGWSDYDADFDGQDSDDYGGTDCDDTDADVYYGATETCATDGDDDCDGETNDRNADECVDFNYDYDSDGFGTTSTRCACEPSGTWSATNDDDCDDSNEGAYPGAPDAWYDGVDSDCALSDDYDADGDGYVRTIDVGKATSGVPGSGALPGNDCDDTLSTVNPGRTDTWYDGIDSNCDGKDDYDADEDDSVRTADVGKATTYVSGSGGLPGNDCDDTRAAVSPAGTETCATSYDDDCDGDTNDVDAIACVDFSYDFDGDGYGIASTECTCEEDGYFRADNDEDCDDSDALVNPDAVEICEDGFDNNCDGRTDLEDGDCATTHPGGGTLIRVFAGTFDMGCTPGQSDCNSDESPVMPVTLTNDYYIGETEVTQGEFLAVMGYNPSSFSTCGSSCPVENLTWYEAAAFANAMSDAAGLSQCYTCTGSGTSVECSVAMDPYTCDGYRLPTEAEWEGAARCGEDLLYAGSDDIDRVAWYWDISGATTHAVAGLDPNACGLYDMSGNVWEWTQDWSDSGYYTSGGRTDPTGASSGLRRVDRGGSWYYAARFARVAYRSGFAPGDRFYGLGVRVSRTIEP